MATKKKTTEVETQVADAASVPTFTKKQIVNSNTYRKRADILKVLLNDNKNYSHAEIDEILNNALSGKYQLN